MHLKRFVNRVRLYILVLCTFACLLFVHMTSKYETNQQIRKHPDSIRTSFTTGEIKSPCRWPPEDISRLIDLQTGFYNLEIQIRVREDNQFSEYLKAYYDYVSKRNRNLYYDGSFLKRLVRMDEQIRINGRVNNYHLYPQIINMEATVEAVRECRPVKQYPINNPKLQVLRNPAHVCSPKNSKSTENYSLDLIVFIKSCVNCIKHRQRIRSTFAKQHLWIPFQIQFVFVIGIPVGTDNFVHLFKTNVSQIQISEPNKQFLKMIRLIDESLHYEDLLIGNFHDTYNNLTLKQIFTFHWISLFCQTQTQLFLFLDDDHTLVPFNLIRLIRTIPNSLKPYFAGGSSYEPQKVVRPDSPNANKFAISEDEFPWSVYVPYPTGAGYLLGSQIIQDLAIGSRFTQSFRLEDVYLGILLFKLKHSLVKIPEMIIPAESGKIDSQTVSAMHDQLDHKVNWKFGKLMN